MVRLTMKNSSEVFGIEGYNLPKVVYPAYRGTLNRFPQAKTKNFSEVQAGFTKGMPGPGEYPVGYKWGKPEKKLYVTKKNTYID